MAITQQKQKNVGQCLKQAKETLFHKEFEGLDVIQEADFLKKEPQRVYQCRGVLSMVSSALIHILHMFDQCVHVFHLCFMFIVRKSTSTGI